jgi:protein Jumonji
LDSIYCKYLLPFATLSDDERKKLMNKVDSDRRTDDDIDCVVKGSSVALNTFYRIARNTMAVWFPSANSSTTDSSGIDPEEVRS